MLKGCQRHEVLELRCSEQGSEVLCHVECSTDVFERVSDLVLLQQPWVSLILDRNVSSYLLQCVWSWNKRDLPVWKSWSEIWDCWKVLTTRQRRTPRGNGGPLFCPIVVTVID